jgi:hypothetical protein
MYLCNVCNKKFECRTSVSRHKKRSKTCGGVNLDLIEAENDIAVGGVGALTLVDMIKNNNDFKSFMCEQYVELNKAIKDQQNMMMHQNMKMMEITQQALLLSSTQQSLVSSFSPENVNYIASQFNTNNINNTTTNTFNLNFFLNEQCKDAMNITEFVDSLQLNITDLDNTCDLGYVEAISRIFTRKLKELDIYKRPIHCSDVKREHMLLKHNNVWLKNDASMDKLRSTITNIANKNIKQMGDWEKAHPNCRDFAHRDNTRYMKIMGASMGGSTKDDDEKYMKKIIRNIAKEVVIDK